LNTHQQELIDGLLHYHDRHERLSAVVDRTRHLSRFSSAEKSPTNRVQACTSSVWLIAELEHGLCRFRTDADSPVVRGLVTLIADFFDRATPLQIISCPMDPLELLDLKRGLTPTRRHGLAAVAQAIHAFAATHVNQTPPEHVEPDPDLKKGT
jgi:cysteine desulfuration protein SufE